MSTPNSAAGAAVELSSDECNAIRSAAGAISVEIDRMLARLSANADPREIMDVLVGALSEYHPRLMQCIIEGWATQAAVAELVAEAQNPT
jgi:signal transduction protein with GAF and PtsI domain